jgi:hypothetical protein
MDLAFDDMYSFRPKFFKFLSAPMILKIAKSVFLAVNASLRWLNTG